MSAREGGMAAIGKSVAEARLGLGSGATQNLCSAESQSSCRLMRNRVSSRARFAHAVMLMARRW